MSRLRMSKVGTPATPAANLGEIFYSSTLNPPGLAWIDEAGNVRRLSPAAVRLTGDLAATTSTTLADTTGLVFPVVSGTYYKIQFGVVYTSVTITTGIKLAVTTPTTTIFAGTIRGQVAADATGAEFSGAISASADAVILSGVETTIVQYLAMIDLMILPSANGNVQVQHAAEVGAAGNVIVKQGSYGFLNELV